MTITPSLFEAHLKCPTKCWLRANGEPPSGNAYAEWVETRNESYRTTETDRMLAQAPKEESALAPPAENLNIARWRLAADVRVEASALPRSSRRQAPSSPPQPATLDRQPTDQSLVTSAATISDSAILESRLHAVERIPSEGRGRAAQFIPIRFIFRNRLTQHDKLLLAFDAFVLSAALGREIATGKIIHGDDHATIGVKTSVLAGEVRKRLENIAALLSNLAPPDFVLNRHCAERVF